MANGGMLGTGVDVQSYRRVRDQFLDLQYRAQNMQLGDQTARSDALQNVELSFAEPGDSGIQNALDEFFGSWADLSNSADSGAAKQAVIDKSRTLAQQINDLQGNLASRAPGRRRRVHADRGRGRPDQPDGRTTSPRRSTRSAARR